MMDDTGNDEDMERLKQELSDCKQLIREKDLVVEKQKMIIEDLQRKISSLMTTDKQMCSKQSHFMKNNKVLCNVRSPGGEKQSPDDKRGNIGNNSNNASSSNSWTECERRSFEKVPGTGDDSGHMYEVKMALLLFLRYLSMGSSFSLSSNLKAAGKFDDVVIEQEESPRVVCIQLKHKQKDLTRSDLLSFSGKYSVVSYFMSYRDDVRQNLGEDSHLVLYTNADVPDKLFQQVTENVNLGSSDEGRILSAALPGSDIYNVPHNIKEYETFLVQVEQSVEHLEEVERSRFIKETLESCDQFKYKIPFTYNLSFLKKNPDLKKLQELLESVRKLGDFTLYDKFIDNFRVYSKQANETQLDECINVEIFKITGISDPECFVPLLIESFRNWWRDDESSYLTERSEIWKKALANLYSNLSEKKLLEIEGYSIIFQENVIKQLRNLLPGPTILHMFVDGDSTSLTTCKIHQALDGQALFMSLKNTPEEILLILNAWSSRCGRILVLEADKPATDIKEELISRLQNTIQHNEDKSLVIISNINDFETTNQFRDLQGIRLDAKDTTSLVDLTQETVEKILLKNVLFQGHSVSLNTLLDGNLHFHKVIDERDIIRLLQEEELVVSKPVSKLIDYYIPRTLTHDGESTRAEDLLNVRERVQIIVGDPGAGKSTLMTFLAQEIKRRNAATWVLLVNLGEHTSDFESIKLNDIDNNLVVQLLNKFGNIDKSSTCFEKCYFDVCWQVSGKMTLLLDGFDEICPMYEDKVLRFVHKLLSTKISNIWITSRFLYNNILVKEFGCTSYTIDMFTESDRKNFLMEMWTRKIANNIQPQSNISIDYVLDKISKTLDDNMCSFVGIPLYIKFIAEVLEEKLRDNCDMSDIIELILSDEPTLYEIFLEKQYRLHFDEKKRYDITKKGGKEEFNEFKRKTNRIYKYCALASLFSSVDLEKIHRSSCRTCREGKQLKKHKNVIINNVKHFIPGNDLLGLLHSVENWKPVFIQKSFAEYFVAQHFSTNFTDIRILFKDMVLIENLHTVIKMMNLILSKGISTHTAIINHSLNEFTTSMNDEVLNERDAGGRTPLHLSAGFVADETFTRLLLEQGADVTIEDKLMKWTALQYAEAAKKWGHVNLLLKYKADRSSLQETINNIKDRKFITSTMKTCCENGYEYLLQFLFDEGVSANVALDEEHHTPIHFLARRNSYPNEIPTNIAESVINLLLKNGANVNLKSLNGKTAVHYLAQYADMPLLKYMLERQVDETEEELLSATERLFAVLKGGTDKLGLQMVMVQYRDDDGRTALNLSEMSGNDDVYRYLTENIRVQDTSIADFDNVLDPKLLYVVQFLIEDRGADIRAKDSNGKTPLHYCVLNRDLSLVEYLIKKGADVYCKDGDGDTIFHVSVLCGNLNMVKFLTDNYRFDPNARGGGNLTPLQIACGEGHIDIFKHLVDCDADLAVLDSKGENLLHISSERGHLNLVYLLVEHFGFKPNARGDISDVVPLHRASQNDHLAVVKYLVKKGAKNVRDKTGNFPIHFSTLSGKTNVAAYLLQEWPKCINIRGQDKKTPFHMACSIGHCDVAHFLHKMGAQTDARDWFGRSPLHDAVENSDITVLSYLIKICGLDTTIVNREKDSLMHVASSGGHRRFVEYLIQQNCPIDTPNQYCNTPLHLAASNGHLDIVKLLIGTYKLDPDVEGDGGYTSLHFSCTRGHLAVVKYLIEMGAYINSSSKTGIIPLHLAVLSGKMDVIKFLVESCECDVNSLGHNKWTSVHYACAGGHLTILEYLIRKGSDVRLVDEFGDSCLHLASMKGYFKVVKFLVEECGMSPNIKGKENFTPLHYACQEGHFEIAEYFIDKGVKVKPRDNRGQSLVHLAAENGHCNILRLLTVKCDSYLTLRSKDRRTPVHSACVGGRYGVLEYLYASGAPLDDRDNQEELPLHVAARNGHLKVVNILLRNRPQDVDSVNCFKQTPLFLACSAGHLDVVLLLIERGANTSLRDEKGNTILHAAAQHGHLDVTNVIVEMRACISSVCNEGFTPLHRAAIGGHLQVVKCLAKIGVSPFSVNYVGDTPVHDAAYHGRLEMVKYFINMFHYSPNFRLGDSTSIMHSACRGGHIEVVKTLMLLGAKPFQGNSQGLRPLHVAAAGGHLEVVKFLVEECGMKPGGRCKEGKTSLHFACTEGHLQVVRYLYRKLDDISVEDNSGRTSLHEAADNGHLSIVNFLIEEGHVDPNVSSRLGMTPLYLACRKGHTLIVKFLLRHKADPYMRDVSNNSPMIDAKNGKFNKEISSYLLSMKGEKPRKRSVPKKK